MLTFKLALKNILGAGLRTWLNVVVLSIAFVAIIGLQGIYQGMNRQALDAMTRMELGSGQFWHPEYDPYDPLSLEESHGPIPENLQPVIAAGNATPILITPGTIYPNGRIQTLTLKGIPPEQTIVGIPSSMLQTEEDLPVVIGQRMAESAGLSEGDYITVRWRDASGTFDAADARIVGTFETIVQSADKGIFWLPLDKLQTMLEMPEQATLVVREQGVTEPSEAGNWIFRDLDYLTRELQELVQSKSIGGSIMFGMLLAMALLAIFDTQVLSLWRRRQEMGTMMALGMTRGMLIRLFTLEGAMHAILAILLGAVYGIPLLTLFAQSGFSLPGSYDDFGIAIGQTLYPTYGIGLVVAVTVIVFLAVTVVSYLPTRKIAKLEPTDALRGRMS